MSMSVPIRENSRPVTHLIMLKRNKSHGFRVVHLKDIIKTNYAELKSRLSRQWFTQNVFTSATDKCTRSSIKSGNLDNK